MCINVCLSPPCIFSPSRYLLGPLAAAGMHKGLDSSSDDPDEGDYVMQENHVAGLYFLQDSGLVGLFDML